MGKIRLPIGIDSFTKLRTEGCFYADKTAFIAELLDQPFEVNLITRPRRFGKTLLMRTLADFFDIQKDSKHLFTGLEIAEKTELCRQWMNQYPTIFLTFKGVEGLTFESALAMLKNVIAELCRQHKYLAESAVLDETDRALFGRLRSGQATDSEIKDCLYTLMRMLEAHYGKQVILILDEYDVPLAKASENHYYREMLDLIRALLGKALKTNDSLKFAVITGCLRIAKESIFTGTNNFVSNTISDERFSKSFGFTEQDVWNLLVQAKLTDHMEEIRMWYDGYRFGEEEIFCPWDVLNHVAALLTNPHAVPANYWENTSNNDIIRSFINRTDLAVNRKFETLLQGGSIVEPVTENLTYDTLHSSEENLWSILYLTGYLTKGTMTKEHEIQLRPDQLCLKIPNREIEAIFEKTVAAWFRDTVTNEERQELFAALWNKEDETATKLLSNLLFRTISYHDYKESYYHAFLTGLFVGTGYAAESNYEYGEGRPDLVVRDDRNRRVLVIEIKHAADRSSMKSACRKALDQIQTERYAEGFLEDYHIVHCYGISFYKKDCIVKAL